METKQTGSRPPGPATLVPRFRPPVAAKSRTSSAYGPLEVPVQRVGAPSEIAEAVALLCSEAAGYVTGVVLDIDGGLSLGNALR
jgi:3-oxoacyl-[acyl-carrier protein] reductase